MQDNFSDPDVVIKHLAFIKQYCHDISTKQSIYPKDLYYINREFDHLLQKLKQAGNNLHANQVEALKFPKRLTREPVILGLLKLLWTIKHDQVEEDARKEDQKYKTLVLNLINDIDQTINRIQTTNLTQEIR